MSNKPAVLPPSSSNLTIHSSILAYSPEWVSAVSKITQDRLLSSELADWIALIDQEYRAECNNPPNLVNSIAPVDLPIPCEKDDDAGIATFLPSITLNNLAGVTSYSLRDWSSSRRHLLNHFLQSVSRALVVVDDEDNPFLRNIVPMAFESPMVRHGLLALSASHLSKVYPVFEQDMLVHRSSAVQALRTNLIHHESTEWGLITTLLLCLVEICEGHSRRWLLHLHGASALLANVDPAKSSRQSLGLMVNLYNYLCCVISATSHDIPPLHHAEYAKEHHQVHPLFGVAISLYKILPSMNRLEVELQKAQMGITEARFQAYEIEQALQNWSCCEKAGRNRHREEARAAACAMQWALILRLNHVTKKLENDDPQIIEVTNNILSAISLIRPGSEIESRILLPLFMAGVGSATKANRLTVEYRLSIMDTTIGFGNINIAHKLLDELWRRSNEGEVVDWVKLRAEKYPGLVLL